MSSTWKPSLFSGPFSGPFSSPFCDLVTSLAIMTFDTKAAHAWCAGEGLDFSAFQIDGKSVICEWLLGSSVIYLATTV